MISSPSVLKSLLGAVLLSGAGMAHTAVHLNLTTQTTLPGLAAPIVTPPPAASGVINGATYSRNDFRPTGTGVIDPFVRVGMQGSAGESMVQAYNTTVNGVLNNSSEDTWNHEVKFGDMAIQTVGNDPSKSFVRFLLDINQNQGGTGEFLNLDDVQIFISSDKNQSTSTFSGGAAGDTSGAVVDLNGTLVYRMDAAGTGSVPVPCTPSTKNTCNAYDGSNRVTLDYSLNSGSGSGDLFLDVPTSFFNTAFANSGLGGTLDGAYVYLYSRFGSNPYENNDGFEEWAFLAKVPGDGGGGGGGNAPEPSSLLLAGLGILAVRATRKGQRTAA